LLDGAPNEDVEDRDGEAGDDRAGEQGPIPGERSDDQTHEHAADEYGDRPLLAQPPEHPRSAECPQGEGEDGKRHQ
jgi:hypothetical protein